MLYNVQQHSLRSYYLHEHHCVGLLKYLLFICSNPLVTNCNGCEDFYAYKVLNIHLAIDITETSKGSLECMIGSSLQAVFCACSCSAFLNCAILLCMMVLVQNYLEEEFIRKYNFHEQSFCSSFLTKNFHGCSGINNELTNQNLKIHSLFHMREVNKTANIKQARTENGFPISELCMNIKTFLFFCSA